MAHNEAAPVLTEPVQPARLDVPALDAVAAWKALEPRGAWLLASDGAHPLARQDIVPFDPCEELEVRDGIATWRILDGSRPDRTGKALDLMRAFARAMPRTSGSGFQGGLVGWVGFEAARLWYPHLPTPPARDLPDVLWRYFRGAFVREGQRAHLVHLDGSASCKQAAEILRLASAAARAGVPDGTPGTWATSLDEETFAKAVARLQKHIHDGDIYQANLATRFQCAADVDPRALLSRLREANPSPYMAALTWQGSDIVSGSPELLFQVQGDTISSRPIAGTRARAPDASKDEAKALELRTDPKEQAEHMMLVDLVRNDVARVSVPGTVRVTEDASVERYRHVMHLASHVEGRLRPGTDVVDWLGALFPGGTVTGAPKERATRRIMESEPVARGPYTGSIGYLSTTGDACFNILIRTLVASGGTISVHAGSGIVADSQAPHEWKEAKRKAEALLQAAFNPITGGSPHRLGDVTRHASWSPPAPVRRDARVLLVDCEDSFLHNVADYLAAAGASVRVVDHRSDIVDALERWGATHLVLGPGPGHPDDYPHLIALLDSVQVPVLGICLGHQVLATASGAAVHRHEPVHGKVAQVHHKGGWLEGLPDPFSATRYHSLRAEAATLPPHWIVDAWLEDGTVMAMRHRDEPRVGVQFHPESMGTPHGMELLARFLEFRPADAVVQRDTKDPTPIATGTARDAAKTATETTQ